jgi:hypothetical protein
MRPHSLLSSPLLCCGRFLRLPRATSPVAGVSQCVTTNSPERCMQRCQQSLQRCSRSGVLQMPIGFRLHSPPEFEARAQAPVPAQPARRPRR